jgi:hypothetical protein
MVNFPSWVAPMTKPVAGLQNLAQTYAQPHVQRQQSNWTGQGTNPNQPMQHQQPMQSQQPQQQGLQGLESRIPPELMQFLQPFLGMMQGQGGTMGSMKGLLGFQPIEHNPFASNQPSGGSGGGLYGG